MEKEILRITKVFCIFVLSVLFSSETYAQMRVTFENDKAMEYQLRSMENGKWEFHPGLWYVLFHKDYSGGYWSGLNIKWDQKKSKVKQITPARATTLSEETLTSNIVEDEVEYIQPLAKEDALRFAERSVDAVYPLYQSRFNDYLSVIEEMINAANEKSNGSLISDLLELSDEKSLLEEEIDYIHQQGPLAQMEQAKRELAYETVLDKLKTLHSKTYRILQFAYSLYKLQK